MFWGNYQGNFEDIVFIVNFEDISHLVLNVSIADYEQVKGQQLKLHFAKKLNDATSNFSNNLIGLLLKSNLLCWRKSSFIDNLIKQILFEIYKYLIHQILFDVKQKKFAAV